jgi:Protein of unknown function (DUF4197)
MKTAQSCRLIGLVVMVMAVATTAAADRTSFGQDVLKSAQQLAAGKDSPQNSQIVDGLKEALQVGTDNAVKSVSRPDGYYKNQDIKILLPQYVQNAETVLRAAGMGATLDEFEQSMNRAAEKAAPQAKSLFLDAVKQMNVTDAEKILNGRDNEATLYFKDKTSAQLQALFIPIVKESMSSVGVTRIYQSLEQKIQSIPFAGATSFNLDQYVTEKSIDGIFVMLAKEEASIRKNPAARVTDLLKNVFGNR